MTKNIIKAISLGVALTQVQAATVTLNVFDGDLTFVSPAGLTTVTSAATSGNDLLYTIVTTGDVDGLGIASDTLTVIVRQARYDDLGAAVAVTDVANSLGGTTLAKGHTFTFAIDSVSYTRGEGYLDTTTFNGFNTIGPLGDQGAVLHTGTAGEYLGTQTPWSTTHGSSVPFGGVTGVASVTVDPASAATNTFFRGLGFQFDVDSSTTPIPEPTSAALLSIAGLGLLARRRK